MDLGFLRRAEARFASRNAAQLDFVTLVAMLRAQQESRAAASQAMACALPCPRDPLAELLSGGPAWRQAGAALRGSFNPGYALQWPGHALGRPGYALEGPGYALQGPGSALQQVVN